jgi:hypothetical protein
MGRSSPISGGAALVAGVIAALAIAAPVAAASADTPLPIPASALATLPAINTLSFADPSQGVAVAIGPTVIGDVFNGGTTVVVANGSAVGSTNNSP